MTGYPTIKTMFGEVESLAASMAHVLDACGTELAALHPEAFEWMRERSDAYHSLPKALTRARGQGKMTPTLERELVQITRTWAELRPYGGFRFMMIDPPWYFSGNSEAKPARNARAHYQTRPLAWVKRLPVRDVLAADALVWLWATNPCLEQAFEAARSWGLRYVTAGTWGKVTTKGAPHMGGGHVLRGCNEPFLILAKGKPKVRDRGVRGMILSRRREHSRKPEEAYAAAERICPDGPRFDVFARQVRPGWTAFGNQTDHFPSKDAI